MPAKLPDNIREGLESEVAGLVARISAHPDDDPRAEGWAARVKDINSRLGVTKRGRPKKAAEKRPDAAPTEKR